ncbi:MAG: MltR family transcriptional regulator [Rhizomicrobium sp.]
MPLLDDQGEIDAYYLADSTQPRAAAILWPIIVEHRIDSLFELALRPDKKVHEELFQPSGALGNYAVKVRLAYMLGWIAPDDFADLITISKIRNRFAHFVEVKDFSDQKIADWLSNLQGSKLLPQMIKQAKEEASGEKIDPAAPSTGQVSKRGKLFILEGIAAEPQGRFRWCIDCMIHQLDKYAGNMKRNLESLPGSWLVGDSKLTSH